MTLHQFLELLSLGLTIPTIVTAAVVVYLWVPACFASFREKDKQSLHWLIIGVAISFFGAVMDNAYWLSTWTAHYAKHPMSYSMIENGVYFNIVSSLLCGTAAAYCHLKAAIAHFSECDSKCVSKILRNSLIAGLLYALAVWYVERKGVWEHVN